MRQLIEDNNFDELKKTLGGQNSKLKIHHALLQILLNNSLQKDEYGFEANRYQEEFFEGFDLYKALNESETPREQLNEFKAVLVFLVFKLGGFIKLLADTAMEKGAYLSQMENVYIVNPALRGELQSFIDLLAKDNDAKAFANVAAAKSQVTLSIGDLLDKQEIGNDMLQFAGGYENVGMKDQATQIYWGIMMDFGNESVSESSGLFPEITHVDTRPAEEIAIYEKAKARFEVLAGITIPEQKQVHIDNDPSARKLAEAVHGHYATGNKKEKLSFGERLKKFFS